MRGPIPTLGADRAAGPRPLTGPGQVGTRERAVRPERPLSPYGPARSMVVRATRRTSNRTRSSAEGESARCRERPEGLRAYRDAAATARARLNAAAVVTGNAHRERPSNADVGAEGVHHVGSGPIEQRLSTPSSTRPICGWLARAEVIARRRCRIHSTSMRRPSPGAGRSTTGHARCFRELAAAHLRVRALI